MNRLIEKAPTKIEVDGIIYNINTNFRDCLKIMEAFEDRKKVLTDWQKRQILLINLFGDNNNELPETLVNTQKAAELGVKFLNCGKDYSNQSNKECFYSLTQDSEYISSAILNKVNGIDLDSIDYMHWWTFINHFMGIGESTFSTIVNLRNRSKNGKLTKEEKAQCEAIGWDVINQDISKNRKQIKVESGTSLEDFLSNDS